MLLFTKYKCTRVARLAFSFEYLAFFGGTWPILTDWCFGFSNVFLKSVIRHFWTVVSVFSQKLSGNPQKNKLVAYLAIYNATGSRGNTVENVEYKDLELENVEYKDVPVECKGTATTLLF